MKIYYRIIKIIIKCKSNYYIFQKTIPLNIIALDEAVIKNLMIIYANKNIYQCYLIIANISINYKK